MNTEPTQDLNHRVKEFARNVSKAAIADGFKPVGLHEYTDAQGNPVYWKVRLKHPAFDQAADALKEKYQGKAKWIRALSLNADELFQMKEPDFVRVYPDGNGKKPLYNLPGIINSGDAPIFITEGEQKADALVKLGLVATTSGGSSSTNTTHWQPLAGRTIRIWPDNDEAGSKCALSVSDALLAIGCTVAVLDVSALGLQAKGDVIDWLELHPDATAADVLALAVIEPEVQAANDEHVVTPESDDQDIESVIRELSQLSAIEYETRRTEEAKRLKMRASVLDRLVSNEQQRNRPATEDAGSGLIFDEVEAWPHPVNGAALLDELTAIVQRFTVLSLEQARAVALWCVFTWFIDGAKVSPMLNITSPEKRCGKSTLLLVINALVCKAILASNISPAALFRCIEAWTPTLLIDETDAFLNEKDELRGILNAGHYRKTAFVIRTVGDDHEPKKFMTWCAKVLCGIGKIAFTLIDRSIVIELRRKLLTEQVENIHFADEREFLVLKQKMLRWQEDSLEQFKAIRPERIGGINDRAADNWQPLQSVAALAGGDWPERCKKAAIVLTGIEDETPSVNVELLMDIAEVFHNKHAIKLHTADVLEALCADEDKQWSAWNRGKPINAYQISKRLSEFGIKPHQIKIGTINRNGYELAQFNEAIVRYGTKAKTAGDEDSTPLLPLQHKAPSQHDKLYQEQKVGDEKMLKPLQHNEGRVVEDSWEVTL